MIHPPFFFMLRKKHETSRITTNSEENFSTLPIVFYAAVQSQSGYTAGAVGGAEDVAVGYQRARTSWNTIIKLTCTYS